MLPKDIRGLSVRIVAVDEASAALEHLELPFTNRDAEWLRWHEQVSKRIAQIFGVSMQELGVVDPPVVVDSWLVEPNLPQLPETKE